jgi:hypothetical protein
MNNLRKQHVIMVDTCCMCKKNEESVFYFLLHCVVVCSYEMLFSAASVYLGLCLDKLLICLIVGGLFVALGVPLGRKIVPSYFLWCLWRDKL